MTSTFRDLDRAQSSKKTKIDRDPNLDLKMSNVHISLNDRQIWLIFLMKIVLNYLFSQLWTIAIELCVISTTK